ncbi:NAD(P)-dependent oxidoreductase [Chitinilyticum piscinae]|uniref:NAD(P)H-binding protein n=1 Tax=Chitinilyticum piscinae TaxID=2866724 RepID=A0A8J7FRJ9_9NEIS|nr:NAD(P)H-binding protein [Chitinilyticum piscinae]MBE9610919.1 NAD(P)H-binding protein [Chitinilyticum piscinae]
MSATHDLLIFGASGKLGLWLVRHARERGLSVAALLREERDASALEALGVTILRGDALLRADCEQAVRRSAPRTVISLLGGKDAQGRRIDATGNLNVIAAMQDLPDCRRLLLITSYGCGEQFELLGAPAQAALGEALAAKTQAEQVLQQSALLWTIIRPAGLCDADGVSRYTLNPARQENAAPYLPRHDVALAICDQLREPAAIGKIITVFGPPRDGD